MPELGPLAYLASDLLVLKLATSGESGLQAQTWREILAFSEATKKASEPWERQALFDMSWNYVQEFTKSASPFMKSPMERPTDG
jgi:hypothetical protein